MEPYWKSFGRNNGASSGIIGAKSGIVASMEGWDMSGIGENFSMDLVLICIAWLFFRPLQELCMVGTFV